MKKRRFAFAALALLLLAYAYWRRLLVSEGVQEAVSNATSPATAKMARTRPEPEMVPSAPLNLFVIMSNLKSRPALASNFERFYNSLLEYSSKHVVLHAICDKDARHFLSALGNSSDDDSKTSFVFYDAAEATERVKNVVAAMKPHFSSAQGSYYSDDLFFLSLGLHLISPLEKVVLVDLDTELRADPAILYQFFDLFSDDHLFGLAPELSPIYKHILFKFLHSAKGNPKKIGEPDIEDGISGFNSGVVLLHLDRMRLSAEYESLISAESVTKLAQKYQFKGHLGDQDFFTLLGLQHPQLIFKLPCSWNRQMCQWWREHGYADIFDRYFACEGKVKLYHGNCNSKIPDR